MDADVLAAITRLKSHIDSGAGLERFRAMVAAQGGDLDAPRPIAPALDVPAECDGYVVGINAEALGLAVIEMGGGRKQLSDTLDLSTGLEMQVRIGDRVHYGEKLARVFAKPQAAELARSLVRQAITIEERHAAPIPLIVERIDRSSL